MPRPSLPLVVSSLVRRRAVLSWLAVAILAAGCSRDAELPGGATSGAGGQTASRPAGDGPAATAAGGATAGSAESKRLARPRVVFLGDSLTAGYGLDPGVAFPDVVQQKIDAERLGFEVVNMGVSGDTSAGGRRRLDWALEGDVRVLVVALGGNDGLRGLPPSELRANLAAILDDAKARGIGVLLCGMEAPPNFGREYTREFRDVYPSLAREKQVALLPFLLDGVAGDPAMNQPDGIHPSVEGARRVADLVWTALRPLLHAAPTHDD